MVFSALFLLLFSSILGQITPVYSTKCRIPKPVNSEFKLKNQVITPELRRKLKTIDEGSQLGIICKPDYDYLDRNITSIICQDNGKWLHIEKARCVPKMSDIPTQPVCPGPPPRVRRGCFRRPDQAACPKQDSLVDMSRLIFVCRIDKNVNQEVRCTKNGTWEVPTVSCFQSLPSKFCQAPPEVPQGYYTRLEQDRELGADELGTVVLGTSLELKCSFGYEVEGNATITCSKVTGAFSTAARCRRVCCEIPPLRNGLFFKEGSRHIQVECVDVGTSIEVKCQGGYKASVNFTHCQGDNLFSDTPVCSFVNTCTVPKLPSYSLVTYKGKRVAAGEIYPESTVLEVECEPSQQGVPSKISCSRQNETGFFEFDFSGFTCSPPTCHYPKRSPRHGHFVKSDGQVIYSEFAPQYRFQVGEKLRITCEPRCRRRSHYDNWEVECQVINGNEAHFRGYQDVFDCEPVPYSSYPPFSQENSDSFYHLYYKEMFGALAALICLVLFSCLLKYCLTWPTT